MPPRQLLLPSDRRRRRRRLAQQTSYLLLVVLIWWRPPWPRRPSATGSPWPPPRPRLQQRQRVAAAAAVIATVSWRDGSVVAVLVVEETQARAHECRLATLPPDLSLAACTPPHPHTCALLRLGGLALGRLQRGLGAGLDLLALLLGLAGELQGRHSSVVGWGAGGERRDSGMEFQACQLPPTRGVRSSKGAEGRQWWAVESLRSPRSRGAGFETGHTDSCLSDASPSLCI